MKRNSLNLLMACLLFFIAGTLCAQSNSGQKKKTGATSKPASTQRVTAKDVTGIWRGYFISESGDQYKLEFQVRQNPSSSVQGVSYSYLDTRFYGKATMTGNFALSKNTFSIQELRTVEVRNLGGGTTCLMNYRLTYSRSGKEEFLEGTYVGKREDRFNPKNNGEWGDCGGGTVYLRKVPTSDFYTEPFLKNTPPLAQKPAPKATPPIASRNTPRSNPPATTTPKNPPVARTQPPRTNVIKKDTVSVQPSSAPPVVRTVERPRVSIPVETRDRKNELTQTFIVTSKEIMVRLYDNGEIDDDTISVYLDGKLILSNKKLSASPITYTIQMNEEQPEHVLVMVAENMGRIPPNTSLMIVQDGDKRYQSSITSTEQKNAMVRFRYQKPDN
jgi:hypothetical protein